MNTNTRNIDELSNATAYDGDNDKLGSVKEVYINDSTGQPDFIEVGHGLFGMSSSLVPLRGHRLEGEDLHLAFSKDRIKDAPNLDADEHLDPQQLEALYHHYGLDSTQNVENYADTGRRDPAQHGAAENRSAAPGAAGTAGVAGGAAGTAGVAGNATGRHADVDPVADPAAYADAKGDRRGDDDAELTRSEEQLHVSKDRATTGQVRLRKHVVHDTENIEVPVEREEVRVERTPVDPSDVTNRDANLTDDEASVNLHEERVNVTKESVPVEKVKLEKDVVPGTETVTEDVAHEEIDTEKVADPSDPRNRRNR